MFVLDRTITRTHGLARTFYVANSRPTATLEYRQRAPPSRRPYIMTASAIPANELASFHEHLNKSKRIIALCGAGLSAASGLPTFRGAGGLWRTHQAMSLATPGAWQRDPGLVWQFYNYRRHMSLEANPNAAHYALAALARQRPEFQCLSQNVDGLSQRANHPRRQLQLLHGSLFDVKCDDEDSCSYKREDFNDPFCPALAVTSSQDLTTNEARAGAQRGEQADISDANVPLSTVSQSDLPTCPQCNHGVLRPGVVWFGEPLPGDTLKFVDDFIYTSEPIDLILVIGTSASVYPAAGYVAEARTKDTRVAVINMDRDDVPAGGDEEGDWFFQGDAAVIVPELLRPVIGDVSRL